MRIFEPASPFIGRSNVKTQVVRWELTAGRRLYVVFTNGERVRSEYPSVGALCKGEKIVEVTP